MSTSNDYDGQWYPHDSTSMSEPLAPGNPGYTAMPFAQPGDNFGAPVKPQKSTALIVGIVVGSVVAALAVIGLVIMILGTVGSSMVDTQQSGGFHNPTALARSVTSTFNSELADEGYSYRVDTTTCIKAPSGEYTCLLEYSDGDRESLTVTVAADGESWISR